MPLGGPLVPARSGSLRLCFCKSGVFLLFLVPISNFYFPAVQFLPSSFEFSFSQPAFQGDSGLAIQARTRTADPLPGNGANYALATNMAYSGNLLDLGIDSKL